MSDFVASDVALLRRNRLLLALGLVPLAFGLLALLGPLALNDEAMVVSIAVGVVCALVGAAVSLVVIRTNPLKVAVPGTLSAGEEGVRFAGQLLAPRASLRAGFLIPTWGKPPLVRLERRFPHRSIELQMRDEPSGRALLRALGLDASQVVASFTFASRAHADARVSAVGWSMLLLLVIGFGMVVATIADSAGLSLLLLYAGVCLLILIGWIVVIAMPTRVVVGADGVLVSWFFRQRFMSYSALRAVRPFGAGARQGVALWPASGAPLKLPMKSRLTPQLTDQAVDLVTQRIQQAIATFHQQRRHGEVMLPERGDRSPSAWIQLLRSVGSGAHADHRTAPVAREELFRVVEDPGADPATRARAAVAVGGGLDGAGRARLRIAAEATAAPEMRALLELAAEEADEAEVSEALARIPGAGGSPAAR